MAASKLSLGTLTQFSGYDNLNSLGTANAKCLGTIDNSTALAPNYKFQVHIVLGSSGVSTTGTVRFYLMESDDDTVWTDNLDPDADGTVTVKNAISLPALVADTNSQVIKFLFDLNSDAGRVASRYLSLICENQSGAAFASSGHDAKYVSVSYE